MVQSPVLKVKPPLPELPLLLVYLEELKAGGAAGGPSVPLLHATGGMGVLSISSPQSDMLQRATVSDYRVLDVTWGLGKTRL